MAYTDEVVADAPVGYFRLGEASGTSATNAGSVGTAGTYAGTPTLGASSLVGDADTAVTFDGVDDRLSVGASTSYQPQATTGVTYEFLYKGTSGGNSNLLNASTLGGALMAANTSSSFKRIVLTCDTSGKVYVLTENNYDITGPNASGTSVNDDSPHHILVTISTAYDVAIWVDGVREALNTTPNDAGTGNTTFYLGWHERSNTYVPGTFDEFAIYNKVLTDARIQAHAAAAGLYTPPDLDRRRITAMFGVANARSRL